MRYKLRLNPNPLKGPKYFLCPVSATDDAPAPAAPEESRAPQAAAKRRQKLRRYVAEQRLAAQGREG